MDILCLYILISLGYFANTQTLQNVFISAMCESKCYQLDPVLIQIGEEKQVRECLTNECRKCLIPITDEQLNKNQETRGSDLFSLCDHNLECLNSYECLESATLGPLIINNNIINKPTICLESGKEQFSADVTIKWSINQNIYPSVNVVLARSKRENEVTDWKFLNKTTDSLVTISNVSIDYQYQFSVIAVFPNGSTIAEESEWMPITKPTTPKNVHVLNMVPSNKGIDVALTWDMLSGKSCYYDVHWLPLNSLKENIKIQPVDFKHSDSVVLTNASYATNYIVNVMSTNEDKTLKNSGKTVMFTTPSCLDANNNNFNICGPNPPEDIQIRVVNNTVEISWQMPLNSSPKNNVTDYVIEIIRYTEANSFSKEHWVNGTTFNFTLDYVLGDYIVHLYAVSCGGKSIPAMTSFTVTVVGNSVVDSSDVTIGVLITCVFLGVLTSIDVTKMRRKIKKSENEAKTTKKEENQEKETIAEKSSKSQLEQSEELEFKPRESENQCDFSISCNCSLCSVTNPYIEMLLKLGQHSSSINQPPTLVDLSLRQTQKNSINQMIKKSKLKDEDEENFQKEFEIIDERKVCKDILRTLNDVIDQKLENGAYLTHGFDQYMADLNELRMKYNAEIGTGTISEDVLREFSLAKEEEVDFMRIFQVELKKNTDEVIKNGADELIEDFVQMKIDELNRIRNNFKKEF